MKNVQGFYSQRRRQLTICFVLALSFCLQVCARADFTIFLNHIASGLVINKFAQEVTLQQASYGYNPQRDSGVGPLYARVPAKDSSGHPTLTSGTADYRYTCDVSTLAAAVLCTLTVATSDSLSTFTQDERVDKNTQTVTLGGVPQATLVTASGKQYPTPPAALELAVSTASERTGRTQSLAFS